MCAINDAAVNVLSTGSDRNNYNNKIININFKLSTLVKVLEKLIILCN